MVQRIQTTPVRGFGSFTSNPKSRGLDTFSGAPQISKTNTLLELSKSLGVVSENNYKKAYDDEVKKQKLLQAKSSVYVERIKEEKKKRQSKDKNDTSLNVIDKVKVGELFPEMSDTTSMIVAEAIGKNATKKDLEDWKENLLRDNPSIIYNKEALDLEIKKKQAEIVDSDNGDFYKSGALSEFNSLMPKWSSTWANERATYQKNQTKEALSGDIENKLNDVTSPQDLKNVGKWLQENQDKKNKKYGVLKPEDFNNTVVDSYIRYADKFNDVKVLDSIPDRFLNSKAKDKIQKFRESILSELKTDSDYNYKIQKRKEDELVTKGIAEIQDKMLSDDPNDIKEVRKKYVGKSDNVSVRLKEYLLKAKENEINLDIDDSTSERDRIETAIKRGATTGDYSDIGITGKVDREIIKNAIRNSNKLLEQDKKLLLNNLDKSLNGFGLANTSEHSNFYKSYLGNRIDALEKSTMGDFAVGQMKLNRLGIPSLSGAVKEAFDLEFQNQMSDWLFTNKAAPFGNNLTVMRKEAMKAAKEELQYLENLFTDTDKNKIGVQNKAGKTIYNPNLKTNQIIPQDGKLYKYVGTKPQDQQNPDMFEEMTEE